MWWPFPMPIPWAWVPGRIAMPLPAAALAPVGRPGAPLGRPGTVAGAPVGGPGVGPGAGPAVILPGLLFFRAGAPIGGPVGTQFRGVPAALFPVYAAIESPGGPIGDFRVGLAGELLGRPGRGGAPIGGGAGRRRTGSVTVAVAAPYPGGEGCPCCTA